MGLPVFPSIQSPDVGNLGEQFVDGTIWTPFEAGYDQTRPRHTRDTQMWRLSWERNPLSDADYRTLMAFVRSVRIGGQMFTWTHPFYKTTHTVRFRQVDEFRLVDAGDGTPGWVGSVVLKEV